MELLELARRLKPIVLGWLDEATVATTPGAHALDPAFGPHTGTLTLSYLDQSGASVGEIPVWDGAQWSPDTVVAFANPTAQVGLTTVNGAATTAMRSDAAPALSQAIAPTWTGLHTFDAGVDLNGNSVILDEDADTGLIASTDDRIDVTVAGAVDFQFQANTFNVLSGSAIVMGDGCTIGQAAGPLLTFDDINNYLEITGANVGIGTTTPDKELSFFGNYLGIERDSSANFYVASNCYWDGTQFRTSTTGYGADASALFFAGDDIRMLFYDGSAADEIISWDTVHYFRAQIGVRAVPSGVAALYVPWQSGDTATTVYVGSTNSSNNQIALYAASYSDYAIYAVSTSETAIAGISSNDHGIVGQTSQASMAGVCGSSGTFGAYGVAGYSTAGTAVYGNSTSTIATHAGGCFEATANGVALIANLSGAGAAIFQAQDNGTTVFEIDDGGNVGIGATGVANRLWVQDDAPSDYVAMFFNDGNNFNRYGILIQGGADDGSGVTYYIVCNDGDGQAVGYLRNSGGTFELVDVSDARTKCNVINTGVSGLAVVNRLRVVDYNKVKNPDGPTLTGFIAQEVAEIWPQAASRREDTDLWGVSRDQIVPVLVKAIQELSIELERIKNEGNSFRSADKGINANYIIR